MDYNKLLEKARKVYAECVTNAEKRKLESVFPELAESEDIGERLINTIKSSAQLDYYLRKEGFKVKEVIAWLEKQGTPAKLSEEEQNRFAKGVLSSCALSFIDYLDAHKYEGKMCVSNSECEGIENAFHNAMWDRLHRYYCKYIEKQGKQSIKNIPTRETIFAIWDLGNEWKELTNGSISTEHGTQLDYIQKHWQESEYYLREKQANQKTVNQPKFKVGDWITNGVDFTFKVMSIKDGMYYRDDDYFIDIKIANKTFRLWTIKDAKDGDVLATEYFIFIFKNIDNNNGVHYYCHYEIYKHEKDNQFDIALPQSFMGEVGNSNYSPATKEQRELLFSKMKEAGYEWDADKKELKNVEQKTNKYEGYCEGCNNFKGCVTCVDGDQWAHYNEDVNNEDADDEDYGIDGLWHAQTILEKTLGTVDGYETDDGILEHKCAISAVKKLREQKSAKINESNPETLDKAVDLYYFTYGNGKGGFDYLSLDKFRDIVKTFVEDYEQKFC